MASSPARRTSAHGTEPGKVASKGCAPATRLPWNLGDRRSLARRLAEATLGSACVRMAGMLVTLLVGVQLARRIGPEGYGIYGTVMAIVALLVVPAQLGLPQLLTRELSA